MKRVVIGLFAALSAACGGGGGGGRSPLYGTFEVTQSDEGQYETFGNARWVRFDRDGYFSVLNQSQSGFKGTVDGLFSATSTQVVVDSELDEEDGSSTLYNVVITGDTIELRRPYETVTLVRSTAAPEKSAWVPDAVVDSTMVLPGDEEGDIAWDGVRLWVAGSNTAMHGVTFSSGAVTATIPKSTSIVGLTWDGTSFWSGTGYDYIFEVDTSGTILSQSVDLGSGEYVTGLAWDGTNVWVLGWNNKTLYQYDPAGDTVVSSTKIDLDSPGGLEFVQGSLYFAFNQGIHRCNVSPLQCVQTWRMPDAADGDLYLSGIGYDGTSFYAVGRVYMDDSSQNYNFLSRIQLP